MKAVVRGLAESCKDAGVPTLSVVIPTRNAPPSLARLLSCLAGQTLPAAQYEVLIVAGVTEAEARQHVPANLPYCLRLLSVPGPGPARRRNAGGAAARAPLLLFLDDDMAPETGLLAAHVRAHAAGSGPRVGIGYLPPGNDTGGDWLKAQLRDWWEDVFVEMARPGHRFCYTDVMSGNLSLPTALFLASGGFQLPTTCREDYELGYRLLLAGAELVYCADARSLHEDKTDLHKLLGRKREEGKADVLLARMYPELRSVLLIGRQWASLPLPSRLLRRVTRLWPAAADRLSSSLEPLLGLCECLHLRGLWRIILGGLLVQAYWRGILAEARSWDEVRALAAAQPGPVLESLDLADGIAAAADDLERRARDGVQLVWRGLPLGILPAQAGAEPLRRRHLRAWLQTEGALPLRRAEALCALLGIAGPIDWGARLATPVGERLLPALVTEVDLGEGADALAPLLTGVCQLVQVRQGERILGWLYLEAPGQPRSVGEVLYALLAQLDHTLILPLPGPHDALGGGPTP